MRMLFGLIFYCWSMAKLISRRTLLLPNVLVFFCGLYSSVVHIKPYCRINSVNSLNTSFLWDPWCFDVPIALKPTFINMSEEVDQIPFSDLIRGDFWNSENLSHIFGSSFDLDSLKSGSIDTTLENHWIWNPKSSNNKISFAVYHHLNHISSCNVEWQGWNQIWRIYTTPRVEHFLWLLLHGRLSTTDFFCFVWTWAQINLAFFVAYLKNPLTIYSAIALKFHLFGLSSAPKLALIYPSPLGLNLELGLLIAITLCTSFLLSLQLPGLYGNLAVMQSLEMSILITQLLPTEPLLMFRIILIVIRDISGSGSS